MTKRHPSFLSMRHQEGKSLLQIILLLFFYKRHVRCNFETQAVNLRRQKVERLDQNHYNCCK